MTSRDDDQLLERLGAALAPPASEPSAAEIEVLHRMVAGHDDAVATVTPLPRRGMNWRLGVMAVAALVLVIVLVANRPGGEPRSAELARAQTSLAELRAAIERGDRDVVTAALADVERRLVALEPAERAQVEPAATQLEQRARQMLTTTTTVPPPTPTTTAAPPPTIAPPPPTSPTTVDDKGGHDGRSGSNSGKG